MGPARTGVGPPEEEGWGYGVKNNIDQSWTGLTTSAPASGAITRARQLLRT